MPPKRDINKQAFEDSEFPVLCDICLGPNPYLKMQRAVYGAECKTCTRPFTTFTWSPGDGMRKKKTEICQVCAKMKNSCQACLLDLQYGLPMQLRDAAFGKPNSAPTDNINKAYIAQNMDGKLDDVTASSFGKADPATKELLKKLARTDPNYSRNRPKPCSFFAKGECNRGDACPYRHEIVESSSSGVNARQSIQDRYNGINDPVARKLMLKAADLTNLTPPEDDSITSLFLTNLPDSATQDLVKAALPDKEQADIRSVVLVATSKCAFINFNSRAGAEAAALIFAARGGIAKIGDEEKTAKVAWGRSKRKGKETA